MRTAIGIGGLVVLEPILEVGAFHGFPLPLRHDDGLAPICANLEIPPRVVATVGHGHVGALPRHLLGLLQHGRQLLVVVRGRGHIRRRDEQPGFLRSHRVKE